MRVAVMGAGAVGGYFGAKLELAGHDLTFIARGNHLKAMQNDGLHVIMSPGGNLHVKAARFTNDAGESGVVDLILFCVKSYDTETAAQLIKPLIGDGPMFQSPQTGVENAQ